MKKFMKKFYYTLIITIFFSLCASAHALDSRINISPKSDGFVIPHSNTEKLELAGLAGLDLALVDIAKNEIYARRGLVFQAKEMNEYFKKKTWYKADKKYKKEGLNYFEAANVRFLEGILKNPEILKNAVAEKIEEKEILPVAPVAEEKLPAPVADLPPVEEPKPEPQSEPKNNVSDRLSALRESMLLGDFVITPEDIREKVRKHGITQPKPAVQPVEQKIPEPKIVQPVEPKIVIPVPVEKIIIPQPEPKISAKQEIDKLLADLRISVISQDMQPKKDIKEQVQAATSNPKPLPTGKKGDAVVATARSMIGKPYRAGGRDPKIGFDCSGLVSWVYAQHGVKTSRSTPDLRKDGVKIAVKDMQPGDIVIISNRSRRDSPNGLHAGIYVGGGSMIHAPGRGRKVIQVKLAYSKVLEGRRVIK